MSPNDLPALLERLHALDQASTIAIREIVAERVRQIEEEGWTVEHDDQHGRGEMSAAAACYALSARRRENPYDYRSGTGYPPVFWPWDAQWWKPTSPIRSRVKAAALLIADLARVMRKENSLSDAPDTDPTAWADPDPRHETPESHGQHDAREATVKPP